ncbi:MAG: hypothetical protein AAFX39_09180 [Pseudomonadota bacterium]
MLLHIRPAGTWFLALVLILTFVAALATLAAKAGPADVVEVELSGDRVNGFRFDVTVAHADTGWEHYADLWEVRAPDGTVLGSRTLHHPHVEEQPFTRSLSGVEIPDGIDIVAVCARDSEHGFGGACVDVAID